MLKKCTQCKKRKHNRNFGIDNKNKDKLKHKCRACKSSNEKASKHNLNKRYSAYKAAAKRRNLYFDLAPLEFKSITSQQCYYCNGFSGKNNSENFNGIDRLDSDEGYFAHNCVPCCTTCNTMKWCHDTDTFLKQIKKIYYTMKKKIICQ